MKMQGTRTDDADDGDVAGSDDGNSSSCRRQQQQRCVGEEMRDGMQVEWVMLHIVIAVE